MSSARFDDRRQEGAAGAFGQDQASSTREAPVDLKALHVRKGEVNALLGPMEPEKARSLKSCFFTATCGARSKSSSHRIMASMTATAATVSIVQAMLLMFPISPGRPKIECQSGGMRLHLASSRLQALRRPGPPRVSLDSLLTPVVG